MTTNLHMAPTGIEAQNFQALVPSLGTLIGNGTIDAKNNLDFKMAATLKNAIGGADAAAEDAPAGAAFAALYVPPRRSTAPDAGAGVSSLSPACTVSQW